MKILNLEIKFLIKTILIWTILNFTANLLGSWVTKLLNEAEFVNTQNVFNEFIAPILIQSFLFGICISLTFIYVTKKNLAHYAFVAFQFVVFHLIFILNLKIHNGIHFVSTFSNIGVKYLSYCGSYLVDILYLYFPINGNFENGMFMPDNLGAFYLQWILLTIAYYFGLTWVSIKIGKMFFKNIVNIR